ncbi:MAG: ABC transporter permease [Alphaproteobacteria bacterium]|nr:ABC transporter permease [Alphaproteobacteria bacterium]
MARNAIFSPPRVWAMVLRYIYLMRSSWPRLVELCYWPAMQMILWGFITLFFVQHSSWVAQAAGILMSAALLWDVLYRGQLGVAVPFLEEIWSRNLGQLFVSPLRPSEMIVALLVISMVRTLIGVGAAAAIAAVLYQYSILSLGLPLVVFFANLMVFGWAIGLMVCGLLLRWGLGAESFAWIAIFLVQPVSGIYYPISVLPGWLQPVAWTLPSSYVFEGMRALLIEGRFDGTLLLHAALLNVLWMALGALLFLYAFHVARVRGLLLKTGE